jgi:hypothetical protein
MTPANCPFCGVATDVRHETQQACIEALHAEIARTRRILEFVTEPLPAEQTEEEDQDKQLT